jgi:hypothetical protein
MRLTVFVLFFTAGTTAFSQSAAPAPANPNPQGPTAPQWALPNREISPQPREWHLNPDLSQRTITLQAPVAPRPRDTAQFDPNMIVHPPPSSVGEQAPGTQIAQNLYPGLTLMPIDGWKSNGQQIPIAWPNLKVQNIPIAWPKVEIKSVESGAATNPAPK